MTYQLYYAGLGTGTSNAAMTINQSPSKSFIFDPHNGDYLAFKTALTNGAELQDATGNVMTTQQIASFVTTLP